MPKEKLKKYYSELEKNGFVLVAGTSGIILDGVYHNEQKQELAISWYAGILYFKPLENILKNVTGDG